MNPTVTNSTKRTKKKTNFLYLFTRNEQCDQMKGRKSINLNNPFHNLKQKLQILLQNHQKNKKKKQKFGLSPIGCITQKRHKDKELNT
jgi:hypothetical protein